GGIKRRRLHVLFERSLRAMSAHDVDEVTTQQEEQQNQQERRTKNSREQVQRNRQQKQRRHRTEYRHRRSPNRGHAERIFHADDRANQKQETLKEREQTVRQQHRVR